MDPRERWQALQAHLAAARRAFENGDRAGALERVDAALALDPDFLATHALRDRILAPAEVRIAPAGQPTAASGVPPATATPPLVSPEGWARFEQRARQRRIEHRVEAARSAIRRSRLDEAAAALAEVRELDNTHPDLISLRMEYEAAQHERARQSRNGPLASARGGPALAAAAVFAAMVLGASWIGESDRLSSYPTAVGTVTDPPPAIDLVPLAAGVQLPEPQVSEPIATTGDQPAETGPVLAASITPVAFEPPPAPRVTPDAPAVPASDRRVDTGRADVVPTPAVFPASRPVASAEPPAIAPPSPPMVPLVTTAGPVREPERVTATLPASTPLAPRPPVVEPAIVRDDQLILQALQQYRSAYEALDVSRARAVWPAVNAAALSRAFDGLQSQNLTFENCAVDLEGAAASAVCRGSARYVPKVGSREPRIESRVWNFTLRKAGDDWRIETARTAR